MLCPNHLVGQCLSREKISGPQAQSRLDHVPLGSFQEKRGVTPNSWYIVTVHRILKLKGTSEIT